MWILSHAGISGNEKADMTINRDTISSFSTKINSLTSSETSNIVHHKIMENGKNIV